MNALDKMRVQFVANRLKPSQYSKALRKIRAKKTTLNRELDSLERSLEMQEYLEKLIVERMRRGSN